MAVTTFTLAVDRFKKGEADFIRCVSFDKKAELIADNFKKGSLIAISGHMKTGSYKDKDGKTVYTTDVEVEDFNFLESKDKQEQHIAPQEQADIEDMEPVDSEIPF